MRNLTRAPGRWALTLAMLAAVAGASTLTTGCFPRRGFITIGTAIDILPHGFISVTLGGGRYYYHRGIFYRPYRGGFLVVPAPIGAVIPGPPPGYVMVLVENDPFAYYRGVFYAPMGAEYVVVRPPLGAFVRTLPPGAVTRRVGGVEFKEYAGAWYRPAIRDGDRGYQVTDPPDGGEDGPG
ncbi:MAG TPA: DUF6515 family protein [Longimicrobiales bacterium]|nr:DUF6515 family protein [Longimicrobiales bacterium]